jgi:energy-coupling factor transport system permease protein
MNPKFKLFVLIVTATLVLVSTDFLVITVTALSALVLFFALRIHRDYMLWIKPVLLVMLTIILLQGFTFRGFGFTLEGLYFGVFYAARFVTILLLVSLFVHTTPMSGLAKAFGFLPGAISLVIVLTLALLPRLTDLTQKILNAQKSRGLNFRSPNILRTYFPILVPLFAKTLDQSNRMALAMQARGFESES